MRDRITLSIIWHDHKKPLIISVKKSFLKRLFVFLGFLFLLWLSLQIWGFWNYLERKKLVEHNERLIKNVFALESERKKLEEERQKLESMKSSIEELEQKLLTIHKYLLERGIKVELKKPVGGSDVFKPTEEDRLKALLHMAEDIYKALSTTPLGYPIYGKITSTFGIRKNPFGIGYEFHTGVDIYAPYGSPVRATANGRVVFAGRFGDYGNTVIINHGNGYSTLYGHLSHIEVTQGKYVKAGEVIGRVGSTGRSTGPHLHYEIIYKGKALNPEKFLTWR